MNNSKQTQILIMNNSEKIKSLQTLAELNVDRASGYMKLSEETKTLDLGIKAMFVRMSHQSDDYRKELDAHITKLGGEKVAIENSFLSDVHQAWIKIKAEVSSNDPETLLSSCKFGENIIIWAYESVLGDSEMKDLEIRALLEKQIAGLKTSMSVVKVVDEVV
mgnify:CR=1 FL=1